MRPRDGREGTHRRGVRPALAAGVRTGAQIQGDFVQVLLDQVRQPGPVPAAVSDGKTLHHVVIEHHGPVIERCAERIHASARHVKIRGFLPKPAGRNRHNRVPENAQVLRQREGYARPASRHEVQDIYAIHPSSVVWTRADISTVSPT